MTRMLYRWLVWMHPPGFRREFAGEMLWIYDETAQTGPVTPLLLDGCVSLSRQWLMRSGYWKTFAALAGGLFPILIGGALMQSIEPYRNHSTLSVAGSPELVALMGLAAVTAVCLLAAVTFLSLWWCKLARRRGV